MDIIWMNVSGGVLHGEKKAPEQIVTAEEGCNEEI